MLLFVFLLFCLVFQQPLAFDDIEIINISLLLIRNILCAPERPLIHNLKAPSCSTCCSNAGDFWQQNQLVWNLYAQGLDHLLMALLACPQKVKITKLSWYLAVIIPHILIILVNSFAGPMGSGNCAGDRSNLPRSALETT